MNANLPLRYLAHLVQSMGCNLKGTVSILYAKAETLRTNKYQVQARQTLFEPEGPFPSLSNDHLCEHPVSQIFPGPFPDLHVRYFPTVCG